MRQTTAGVSRRDAVVMASLAAILVLWTASLAAAKGVRGGENAGRLKVRVSSAGLEQSVAAEGGTLVARYGGFSLWEMPSAQARSLARVSPGVEVLEDENRVLLNTGALDTTSPRTKALRVAVGSFDGKRLHLVQFAGPVQPGWYESLVATGVRVIQPIPSNAYLVWGDSSALGRLQSMARSSPVVQWDGPYEADYKIQPGAAGQPEKGSKPSDPAATDLFQVQLVKDPGTNAATFQLIGSLLTSAVRQQYEILSYVNFVVGLPVEAVKTLSLRPDVVSIARWSEPKKLDERQDVILTGQLAGNVPMTVDYLSYLAGQGFTQAQFDASGFSVDISDSGVDNATTNPNHFALHRFGDPALAGRIIYNRLVGTPNPMSTLQGCDGHGNLNTHIVCGYVPGGAAPFNAFPHADAAGFRYGLGVAPFVKMGSSVIFDPNMFTSPSYPNLQSQAYNDGARISTNSWGNAANTYTADSQAYDSLVRDAQPMSASFPLAGNQEMVIVFAAGNRGAGPNTVGWPGTAKNVITVGASESVQAFLGTDGCGVADTGADSANDIIGFSSRGPTSDGRKKPDVVAAGTHVSGGVFQSSNVSPVSGNGAQGACFTGAGVCGGIAASPFWPAGQQWYTASSGSSHSPPAVAGAAALIRQYFINQGLAPPSPAMTKAMLMNTARYMNGAGANDTLWSNSQGMGDVNLGSFFDVFATGRILHDEVGADVFAASGQSRVITGFVSNAAKPFRVTLAWTDAPGPTSGNAFVNDLDLEVTFGGNTYKGNVFSGAFSTTGGVADTRNNVESVFIPAGVTGSFNIMVKASNIAGDGVPNNAQPLDQDFALVAYNVVEAPLPVISGGATAVTAESCGPANNAIDPGETVTVTFGLSNIGTANTTNLVGTLQATGGVTAPSGPQSYGVVTANGPAVPRPFTFTAGTTCAQTITATFQLQDGATNLGTVTFTFRTGALGAPVLATYSSGSIATPIPDAGSVDIPIVITDTGVMSDVNVRVRLNHTFDGDVQLSLVGPTGITVPLVANRGTSGDNFGSGANDCSGTLTIFDDGAATAISAGSAPFAGSFRPESPLAAFNGAFTSGIWKLHAADTAAVDTGTVGCVQLEITRRRFVCCGVPGTPEIASGGPATITAESFAPPNNVPDPGEMVTATFPVINTGDGNTTNLVATLQSSGGVTPVTASQSYGVVAAAGPTVTRPFTFVANGACGGTITATLHVQDGALDLGNLTYTFPLGTTSTSSQTFSNPAPITVPAFGTGATTGSPATPYPSNITVSGVPTSVAKITVTLKLFNHTFPDDVDVLLVSPLGRKMIIMSDSGGSTVQTNSNITLDDAAPSALPDGIGLGSGTFKPSNYDVVQDPFPAPAPAGPYLSPAPGGTDTLTSAYGSQNPNGTWSLYVVDDAGGDSGNINGGWEIAITTAAPPVCSTGPNLAIAKTHTGSFTRGQMGAPYTITVGNAGSAPTAGMVTVTDTPPTGLTAVSAMGTGWTCGVMTGTATCTRSDVLGMGGSYPPVTLTVNVAGNAPPSVTNTATVSGGGDLVTFNNAASDPTCIDSQGPTVTPPNAATTTQTVCQ